MYERPFFTAPGVGVSSKKFHGLSNACTHSVGFIGYSPARVACVVPAVSRTTLSVLVSEENARAQQAGIVSGNSGPGWLVRNQIRLH